jgi:hypothetical protein
VSTSLDAIALTRSDEQLRQESEAFQQAKKKDLIWFYLQLGVAIVAVLLLIALVLICCFILYNNDRFPVFVQEAASAALFGEVLSLLVLVWKVVIKPADNKLLAPVTKA